MMSRFFEFVLSLSAVFVLCLGSALMVVSETHQTRLLFAQLQTLEGERWQLQEDYSRLVIEYSTLSAPHRVSELSVTSLAMASPDTGAIRVVAE
ncbi:MAG: cell division protein FtsL [Halieaceae bacterium]|jgi:cell division protein FtsL